MQTSQGFSIPLQHIYVEPTKGDVAVVYVGEWEQKNNQNRKNSGRIREWKREREREDEKGSMNILQKYSKACEISLNG